MGNEILSMKKHVVRKGYLSQESNKKLIPVEALEIGMFVSELDRPWLDTPFLMQGFVIETVEHINLVQEFCKSVYVDAVQQVYVPPEERTISTQQRHKRYIHKVSVEDEHAAASGVYKQAHSLTKSVLDEVRLGNAFDADKAKQTVAECVESMLRNPDALMWLGKIRNVDSHVADHSLNVAIVSVAFGRYLQLEEEELKDIGLCGLLHDIGKMKIPPEILKKGDHLNEQEDAEFKKHPLLGRNILMSNRSLFNGATDVAHCHHEHLDGSGYPRGLKEVGISFYTRIIAIVDLYDNFTTGHAGSSPKSSLDAMRHLYSLRGKHYDDNLVLQFIQCIGLYPPGSIVELRNGEVGIVISTNHKNRRLPKVLMQLDSNKQECKSRIINLGDENQQGQDKEHLIKDVLINGSYDIDINEHINKGLVFS